MASRTFQLYLGELRLDKLNTYSIELFKIRHMQANDTAHAGNLEFKWLKDMQEESANTVGSIIFNNVEKCSQFLDS